MPLLSNGNSFPASNPLGSVPRQPAPTPQPAAVVPATAQGVAQAAQQSAAEPMAAQQTQQTMMPPQAGTSPQEDMPPEGQSQQMPAMPPPVAEPVNMFRPSVVDQVPDPIPISMMSGNDKVAAINSLLAKLSVVSATGESGLKYRNAGAPQYNGDVDLSPWHRKTKVDSTCGPKGKMAEIYKSSGLGDWLGWNNAINPLRDASNFIGAHTPSPAAVRDFLSNNHPFTGLPRAADVNVRPGGSWSPRDAMQGLLGSLSPSAARGGEIAATPAAAPSSTLPPIDLSGRITPPSGMAMQAESQPAAMRHLQPNSPLSNPLARGGMLNNLPSSSPAVMVPGQSAAPASQAPPPAQAPAVAEQAAPAKPAPGYLPEVQRMIDQNPTYSQHFTNPQTGQMYGADAQRMIRSNLMRTGSPGQGHALNQAIAGGPGTYQTFMAGERERTRQMNPPAAPSVPAYAQNAPRRGYNMPAGWSMDETRRMHQNANMVPAPSRQATTFTGPGELRQLGQQHAGNLLAKPPMTTGEFAASPHAGAMPNAVNAWKQTDSLRKPMVPGGGLQMPMGQAKPMPGLPKLGAFAAAFKQRCEEHGMTEQQIAKVACDLSALDAEIAVELEPLTKAAFLPMAAKALPFLRRAAPYASRAWQGAKGAMGFGARTGGGALTGYGVGSVGDYALGNQNGELASAGAALGGLKGAAGAGMRATSGGQALSGLLSSQYPRAAAAAGAVNRAATRGGAIAGTVAAVPPLARASGQLVGTAAEGAGQRFAQGMQNQLAAQGITPDMVRDLHEKSKQISPLLDAVGPWTEAYRKGGVGGLLNHGYDRFMELPPAARWGAGIGAGLLGASALGGLTGMATPATAGLGMLAGGAGLAGSLGAFGDPSHLLQSQTGQQIQRALGFAPATDTTYRGPQVSQPLPMGPGSAASMSAPNEWEQALSRQMA